MVDHQIGIDRAVLRFPHHAVCSMSLTVNPDGSVAEAVLGVTADPTSILGDFNSFEESLDGINPVAVLHGCSL